MENNTIIVKIKAVSKECEQLREEGLFFETIAQSLGIEREDVEEVN